MSLNLYCLKSAYFVWKIKSLNRVCHYESEEFSFRDKKWFFSLRASRSNSKRGKKIWKLHLVNLHLNECADEFDVETFIEDKRGKLHSFGAKNVKSVNLSKALLLVFTRSVLLSHDPPLLSDETLTVVFKFFHDIVRVQHLSDAVESDKGFNEVALWKESSEHTLYESWFTFPEIKPRGLIQPPLWTDVFSYIDSLSEDFQNLKIGNLHLDAELKCSDRTIPVHSRVLSAQSKVFKEIFQKSNSEGTMDTTISIKMTYSLLKKFIMYIYTGHLSELSEESALQLYESAVKYSVEHLRKRCSKFLADSLSKENACKILTFADAHGDLLLKERALSYIVKNEIHEENDAWDALCEENPSLAVEVLSQAYKSLKSKRSVNSVPMSREVNLKSSSFSNPKSSRKPASTQKRVQKNLSHIRPSLKSTSACNSIDKATASSRDFTVPKRKQRTRPLPTLKQYFDEALKVHCLTLRNSSSSKGFRTSFGRKMISPYLRQKKSSHF